jgi:hypothetical protein
MCVKQKKLKDAGSVSGHQTNFKNMPPQHPHPNAVPCGTGVLSPPPAGNRPTPPPPSEPISLSPSPNTTCLMGSWLANVSIGVDDLFCSVLFCVGQAWSPPFFLARRHPSPLYSFFLPTPPPAPYVLNLYTFQFVLERMRMAL